MVNGMGAGVTDSMGGDRSRQAVTKAAQPRPTAATHFPTHGPSNFLLIEMLHVSVCRRASARICKYLFSTWAFYMFKFLWQEGTLCTRGNTVNKYLRLT